MKSLGAHPGRTGPSFRTAQPSLGAVRRPTASPLRLSKLQSPHFGVTQQTSAPTQAPNDYDATEAAMRAAKERMAGNGTATYVKPVIAESEDIKAQFMKIQAEVALYKKLNDENGILKQEKEELSNKLASQQQEIQQAMETARREVLEEQQKGLAEVEAARQEVLAEKQKELAQASALLQDKDQQVEEAQQRIDELAKQIAAHQEEVQSAVDAAKQETTNVLQLEIAELSMQLQNSQTQLDRLGQEVEAVEAAKAAAVQDLLAEKEQLLLALANATRRLADLVYPAGSLPPGLTITTRLEGDVDMDAVAAQQAAAVAAAVAAASPPAPAEPASASVIDTVEVVEQPVGAQSAPKPAPRRPGFFAWLFSVICFWVYQVLGALLLYYAASILAGVPPALTLELGLGCMLVSTLLPFANRLLVPRLS